MGTRGPKWGPMWEQCDGIDDDDNGEDYANGLDLGL